MITSASLFYVRSFSLHNRFLTCSFVLGYETNEISDISRAQKTLSSYVNRFQIKAFKCMVSIHDIKGAAESNCILMNNPEV